jgi:hypothetical protein
MRSPLLFSPGCPARLDTPRFPRSFPHPPTCQRLSDRAPHRRPCLPLWLVAATEDASHQQPSRMRPYLGHLRAGSEPAAPSEDRQQADRAHQGYRSDASRCGTVGCVLKRWVSGSTRARGVDMGEMEGCKLRIFRYARRSSRHWFNGLIRARHSVGVGVKRGRPLQAYLRDIAVLAELMWRLFYLAVGRERCNVWAVTSLEFRW